MSHRRPPGPAAARPGSRRPIAGRPMRTALVSALLGAALLGSATPAYAVPPPPPNPSDSEIGSAQAQQEAAAAEVGRMQGLVAAAEAELQRVGDLAEAAGTAYMAAEEALMMAQVAAEQTAAELAVAAEAVAASEARIALFSRDSYMNGGSLGSSAALLDAEGPGELIQRAAMLDYVARQPGRRPRRRWRWPRSRRRTPTPPPAPPGTRWRPPRRSPRRPRRRPTRSSTPSRAPTSRSRPRRPPTTSSCRPPRSSSCELQGARNAHEAVGRPEARGGGGRRRGRGTGGSRGRRGRGAGARERRLRLGSGGGGGGGGAASGDYVAPTSGRVSSCYGARWGVTHFGVDIAAPIGTPIYAAHSGVVQRAGAATGFGQAVYIRGDDGAVTVYGHVNRYFVSVGERVSAGEEIAEVGNRGQSTGPHLHFEVHPGGQMYGGQVNPVPWLNARGVFLGGCGG